MGIFFTLMMTLLLAISCRILQLPHYYIRDLELKSKAKKTEDDNLAKLTQKIDAISAKVDLIEARLNESAIREELAELRGQVAAIFALRGNKNSRSSLCSVHPGTTKIKEIKKAVRESCVHA